MYLFVYKIYTFKYILLALLNVLGYNAIKYNLGKETYAKRFF